MPPADLNTTVSLLKTASALSVVSAVVLQRQVGRWSQGNIVIADDALVDKAADAAEIFGGRTPSLFRFSRSATEATIVVGQETAQDLAGGGQIGGAREAEFTGKEILKSAP